MIKLLRGSIAIRGNNKLYKSPDFFAIKEINGRRDRTRYAQQYVYLDRQ